MKAILPKQSYRLLIFVGLTIIFVWPILTAKDDTFLAIYAVSLALVWGFVINDAFRNCELTLQQHVPDVWLKLSSRWAYRLFKNLAPSFLKLVFQKAGRTWPPPVSAALHACRTVNIEGFLVAIWMVSVINAVRLFAR